MGVKPSCKATQPILPNTYLPSHPACIYLLSLNVLHAQKNYIYCSSSKCLFNFLPVHEGEYRVDDGGLWPPVVERWHLLRRLRLRVALPVRHVDLDVPLQLGGEVEERVGLLDHERHRRRQQLDWYSVVT